jgi:hypothetical protein
VLRHSFAPLACRVAAGVVAAFIFTTSLYDPPQNASPIPQASTTEHPVMRRFRSTLCIAAFVSANISLSARLASAEEPLKIKSGEVQLFVDDYLIGSQSDLQRTLRQPKKDNGGEKPVIALDDKEFGENLSTLEANGTIVYDPRIKKYVMLALAFSAPKKGWDRVRIYRFTSDDALKWVKGDNGQPQWVFPTSTEDLLDTKSGTSASNVDLFSYFYDKSDSQYPYKGWLHFANWGEGREGQYYMYSADGIKWHRGRHLMASGTRTIQQDGRTLTGPGDVTIFYHDEQENRFLANLRFSSASVPPGNALRARAFTFVDRLDVPVNLQKVDRIALLPAAGEGGNGDQPYDEYYSSTAWRYGSMWLGALKIWHKKGDYPYSAADAAFFKFVSSRDGLHWKKVQFNNDSGIPEVFLPNGAHGGNNGQNDGGYMTEFSNAPLRIGDELIYYYGSSSWGKTAPPGLRVTGGGIFRARIRPDGFVSVDGGTLTTKPLAIDGKELFVNGIGPISVEVLDGGGKVLGKSSVQGDSLRHKVTFDGRSLHDVTGGKPAQLQFNVDKDDQDGQLYSFTIDPV